MGASEYYAYKGEKLSGAAFTGANVPKVHADENKALYAAVHNAINEGVLASVYSVGIGGLAVALAKTAMGGMLGLDVDLTPLRVEGALPEWKRLYSESQGRFVVTVDPKKRTAFEKCFTGFMPSLIGYVTGEPRLRICGINGVSLIDGDVAELKESYKKTLRW